ncbi:unnamed protein product [Pleuronectes platessa]|uniref:Uncharacterized protein n=1 Tax=Pleuronectes platessa TaxID=8262 RepID=A0A9N7W039_PLEPL|nr:unnamed protein product [Pleuronectes platessa]
MLIFGRDLRMIHKSVSFTAFRFDEAVIDAASRLLVEPRVLRGKWMNGGFMEMRRGSQKADAYSVEWAVDSSDRGRPAQVDNLELPPTSKHFLAAVLGMGVGSLVVVAAASACEGWDD